MIKVKQFLKPDWRKILVTIIIFILFFFFWYYFFNWLPSVPEWFGCCNSIEEGKKISEICEDMPGCCTIENFEEKCNSIFNSRKERIFYNNMILFIFFILSYLISCFIIWIYDKVKKK